MSLPPLTKIGESLRKLEETIGRLRADMAVMCEKVYEYAMHTSQAQAERRRGGV